MSNASFSATSVGFRVIESQQTWWKAKAESFVTKRGRHPASAGYAYKGRIVLANQNAPHNKYYVIDRVDIMLPTATETLLITSYGRIDKASQWSLPAGDFYPCQGSSVRETLMKLIDTRVKHGYGVRPPATMEMV